MRLFGMVATFVVLAGISQAAIRYGDRALFVSPPEAIAEGFVREVILARYAEARACLLNPDEMTGERLHQLREKLIAGVGSQPGIYETRVVSRERERARVNVTLIWREARETIAFDLIFDSEWKVRPVFTS